MIVDNKLNDRVQININTLNHKKNSLKGHQKSATGSKSFPFHDALITIHQLNTIHLLYKHDPKNINEIHIFFVFCTKFCIAKIVKWNFFGIMIVET